VIKQTYVIQCKIRWNACSKRCLG